MKIVGERVLVRPEKIKEKTIKGLIIPEKNKGVPKKGIVLESGVKEIKEKDVIIFKPYSQIEVDTGKEVLFILERKNIIGIVQ